LQKFSHIIPGLEGIGIYTSFFVMTQGQHALKPSLAGEGWERRLKIDSSFHIRFVFK